MTKVQSSRLKARGFLGLIVAVLLFGGGLTSAQAADYNFGSNPPPLNCNGTNKYFNTVRYNTKPAVYFKLTKAAGSTSIFGSNWENWWGVTINGVSDWNYMDGAPQGLYLMTGFLVNTPFKMNGRMAKAGASSTCYPSWRGSINY